MPEAEAVQPWRAEGDGLEHRTANLPKESDVREFDGNRSEGRELQAGIGGGNAEPGGGGDRPDEDDGTGETSSEVFDLKPTSVLPSFVIKSGDGNHSGTP